MELERVTPESVGIPSQAVTDMLDELYRRGIEMHAFMLLRHGKVCAEGCWRPYQKSSAHIMFSFSKSLTSTAIGFAAQEGLLGLDERLVDIFPDKLPENPGENLKKATVRHLLMMACGHETEIADMGMNDPDWIATFLAHPFVYEPGTHFMYNTAGTNLLCAALARRTGQTLPEFLRPRLTEPLGMTDFTCHQMADGTSVGGAGCSLTIEDMARFIQFVANRGKWEGRQLLNEAWFDQATTKQVENRASDENSDWEQGYGFQYWRCKPEGVFRADGAYGQYGIVMTKQDVVLVAQSASMFMQSELTGIWNTLLPQIASGPLPENRKAHHVLENRLKNLELNPMLGMRNPDGEASLEGAVYLPDSPMPSIQDIVGGTGKFGQDKGSLHSLGLSFDENNLTLLCEQEGGPVRLSVGINGHFALTDIEGVTYGANCRWKAPNKLELEIRNTNLAGGKFFTFCFTKDKLTVTGDATLPEVGHFSGPELKELSFTLADGEVNTKTKMYWEA